MNRLEKQFILPEWEKNYCLKIGIEHRKKFAQFFTPYLIADIMSDWILGNQELETVLEPAFGLGIFSRILLQQNQALKIKGFELDPIIFNEAKTYFDSKLELNLKDYIFHDWENKYDGIICNPPYFKFHDYDSKSIIQEFEKRLNLKLNGFTNLYTLFLLKSVYQLKQKGRASYLIPSEFLNADYGKLVKEYLLKTQTLRHIFIIDFTENIFSDALTTTSILFLAKDNHNQELNISNIRNKSDLGLIRDFIYHYPSQGHYNYAVNEINPFVKWRIYYQQQNSAKYKYLVPFSHYAKVVRGIATGANDYFTFNNSKALQYGIPKDNLLPCICKSVDVKGSFFTDLDFKNLEQSDRFVYLFNGINSQNKNVLHYLKKGEFEGINNKYLTKKRNPWYSLENRKPAPIWVSVFNRNGLRFIRNEAGIYNLTTFHCIYLHDSDLFSNLNVDLLFAYLLTDISQEIFDDNRREYGNGLKKFEPNDINNAKILDLSRLTIHAENDIIELFNKYRNSIINNKPNPEYLVKINAIFINEYT
jgi:adenine-specific DNA-methyltransferase